MDSFINDLDNNEYEIDELIELMRDISKHYPIISNKLWLAFYDYCLDYPRLWVDEDTIGDLITGEIYLERK